MTTLLTGRQEMPVPDLGYRSGAYQAPTWVPFQVSRAAQALPSQDADVLVSRPDGPSDVNPSEFLHADFSDCDDVPELSVGFLRDVGRGSAQDWDIFLAFWLWAWSGLERPPDGLVLFRAPLARWPEEVLLSFSAGSSVFSASLSPCPFFFRADHCCCSSLSLLLGLRAV